jgi:hypothetical protein
MDPQRFSVDGRVVLDNGKRVNKARLQDYDGPPRNEADAQRIAAAMQADHDWMAAQWRKYYDAVRVALTGGER